MPYSLRFAGLRGLAVSSLACLPLFATAVLAQSPASERVTENAQAFDIPASSLGDALTAFGLQSGLQMSYSSKLVQGFSVPALKGAYSPREVLLRMLVGTELDFRLVNGSVVVIVKRGTREQASTDGGARTLGPLRVEGAGSRAVAGVNGSTDPTATEGTGSYTSSALTIGSKTPQSMKDTPQSVSVVTQQRMQDQNITDFSSLMNQATGVSAVKNTITQTYYSRGFAIQRVQLDGGSPLNINPDENNFTLSPQFDMAMYDHAELLRGADGLFNGYGSPGGVISLTRKRPLDHGQVVVEAQYGSWNNYRTTLDATAPLGFDGKLRGRGVVAYQDQDYFYDTATSNKTLAYGMLEYDLSSSTTVSVGFDTTRQDTSPSAGGLPRYQSGADLKLPRDTCLCFPWNRDNFDTKDVFARLDQALGADWSLKLNLTRTKQEHSYKFGYSGGTINPVTRAGLQMYATALELASDQKMGDLTLNGSFELFGHRQALVLGANYARVDGGGYSGYDFNSMNPSFPAIDVFHFDPNAPAYTEPAVGLPSQTDPRYGTTQWGGYATLRLTFWDPLHVNLGLRYSHYEFFDVSQHPCSNRAGCTVGGVVYAPGQVTNPNDPPTVYSTHDFTWPPTASLVYDLTPTLSVYGSYADIYKQQSTYVDRSGKSIDPVTGSNVEGGIKWASLDNRLNAALSVYRVEQKNFAGFHGDYSNPADYYRLSDGIHRCCYDNGSTLTYLSQGADLEVTGELLPAWQMSAGYTFNKNEYRGFDSGTRAGQPLQTRLPKHLLKLWSSYQFRSGEWLQRLNVGGGVNAQSKGYYAGSVCLGFDGTGACNGGTANYEFTQGFYAVFNARVAYELNPRWNAALNINNLSDKTYYQTVGSSGGGNWYGEPRSFMLTLRGSF